MRATMVILEAPQSSLPTLVLHAETRETLLVVDDEADILSAVTRLLRRRCRVLTAQNTAQASDILDNEDVHVILCDQRLPRENGVEFFSRIRHKHPDAIRVLFTGYANIDSVIDAINEGAVYRYISKPWQPSELRVIIDQSFDKYHMAMERLELLKDLQASNAQLLKANQSLQEVDDVRRVFMEVISHELNTPVAIVGGYSYLLRRELEPEPGSLEHKSLDRIDTSAKRLKHVADRIFKMLETNDPSIALTLSTFSMRELAQTLHMQVEPFLTKRNLRMITKIDEATETLEADFDKILDALLHVTMNAIKFSEDGKSITLHIQNAPQDSTRTHIWVEDHGVGISPQDLPQVFTAFFSSFNTANHSSGQYEFNKRGVGIGLSLAQKFVHMHGGTISVESTPGQGSRFCIDLPKRHTQE